MKNQVINRRKFTKEDLCDIDLIDSINTLEDYVEFKIAFLYDQKHLILMGKKDLDPREELVRTWLSSYTSFIQIDNGIRAIILGDKTLNAVLKEKGLLK